MTNTTLHQTSSTEHTSTKKSKALSARELALLAARAADNKMAQDIEILDLRDLSDMCDYFVIATANNTPQLHAVLDEIDEQIKQHADEDPLSHEGLSGREWILLDYGAVVVHVFSAEARAFYRLEHLWGDAKRVDWQLA